VRVEVPPSLAAVGRGSGVAGVIVALAGTAVTACVWQPWYAATAELAMLGETDRRTVAVVAAWASPLGLAASVAGLVAVGLGVALALDRHPGWTRPALLVAAAVTSVTGATAWLLRPTLDRFPDGAGALAELRAVRDELPRGVELTLTVRGGTAATTAIVAGVVIALGVAAARDLDRR
jgi:hypothetical protein